MTKKEPMTEERLRAAMASPAIREIVLRLLRMGELCDEPESSYLVMLKNEDGGDQTMQFVNNYESEVIDKQSLGPYWGWLDVDANDEVVQIRMVNCQASKDECEILKPKLHKEPEADA